jgi:hypothetical protein
MSRKFCWSILAVLCCSTWSTFAQEEAPPAPAPAEEALPARPADAPAPPAPEDEAGSPSDQRPDLNGSTSRGYAPGQAPGKQAPHQAPWTQAPSKQAPQQAPWAQAPSKQAPMQQGPVQAPGKGAAYYGDQMHMTGYSGNYNCAGCQPSYQQSGYSGGRTARRGLFGRRWR